MEIREEIGMEPRVPSITRVSQKNGSLYIECEDRADKSIIIGTGGWVVGKLASRLGYKEVKVDSRLDNIIKTKMLMESNKRLDDLDDYDFVQFSKAMIHGRQPYPMMSYVLGEENLWICGFLEHYGCRPKLVHTEFIHDNVKRAYNNTDFLRVDCDLSPYRDRLHEMVGYVLTEHGSDNTPVMMGLFEKSLEQKNDAILVEPMMFYCMDHWRAKRFSKKRFKTNVFSGTDMNRAYMVERVLNWSFLGLIEPTDAARIVHSHWPNDSEIIKVEKREIDQFSRSFRVGNSLRRAKEISQEAYALLKNILTGSSDHVNLKTLVAWSGGIDSTACIRMIDETGLSPDLITVMMPHIDKEEVRAKANDWELDLIELDPPPAVSELYDEVENGNIHPCGKCSSLMENTVKEYALENEYEAIVFGDLLSVGSQSIYEEEGILHLNLPAALSMPKRELIQRLDEELKVGFGCPLVNIAHERRRDAQRISVQRVLRELRAQMLDQELALEIIRDIKSQAENI